MPSPITYSESELISSLKHGEDLAYSYLYDHYGAALYGVIFRVVERQEIAEDVLQEVFLKIYRGITYYDPSKGRLYTWMLQIARNTAIDTLRSKEFRQSKKIQELGDNVNMNTDAASVSYSPVDHIGLDKVLAALNEDQQTVLRLAYFKGYTQEEIAEELDLPKGTVKTRVRNALIQLRKILNIS